MGSQRQKMTFIFDTGSSWLWIPSDSCPKSQCPGNTFHYAQSSTYKATTQTQNIQYGKGSVTGYIVSDQVALTSSSQYVAQNAIFLSIFQATDLSGLSTDGLLGLSPNFITGNNGQLFITSLANSGAIQRSMFSLLLTTSSSTSYIWFGGYDPNEVIAQYNSSYSSSKTTDQLIAWMNLSSKQYWMVSMQYAQVQGQNLSITMQNVVFDSGASLMYIPTDDYNAIFNAIFASFSGKCYVNSQSGVTYCSCTSIQDSRYPTIAIFLGNRYTMYLRNQDYLVWDSSYKQCIFGFQQDNSGTTSFWLLGDPFIRAYYMIFDQDNQRVGLAGLFNDNGPSASSGSSSNSTSGNSGSSSSSDSSDTGGLSSYVIWVIISVGISLFFFIMICIICRIMRRKRQYRTTAPVQNIQISASYSNNFINLPQSSVTGQSMQMTPQKYFPQTQPFTQQVPYGEPNNNFSGSFTNTQPPAVPQIKGPQIRTNVVATYQHRQRF